MTWHVKRVCYVVYLCCRPLLLTARLQCGPTTIDLLDDIICFFRPDERLRVCVVEGNVLHNSVFEVGDAVKDTSVDALSGDFCEPTLHKIEPRRRGGNKVEVEAPVLLQPVADFLLLMGGVIIDDAVDVEVFGRIAVNGFEKL